MTNPTFDPHNIWELPRNDIPAAIEYLRWRGTTITADALRILIQLQDDPRRLIDEIRRQGLAE
jgi:hypothetical protein